MNQTTLLHYLQHILQVLLVRSVVIFYCLCKLVLHWKTWNFGLFLVHYSAHALLQDVSSTPYPLEGRSQNETGSSWGIMQLQLIWVSRGIVLIPTSTNEQTSSSDSSLMALVALLLHISGLFIPDALYQVLGTKMKTIYIFWPWTLFCNGCIIC